MQNTIPHERVFCPLKQVWEKLTQEQKESVWHDHHLHSNVLKQYNWSCDSRSEAERTDSEGRIWGRWYGHKDGKIMLAPGWKKPISKKEMEAYIEAKHTPSIIFKVSPHMAETLIEIMQDHAKELKSRSRMMINVSSYEACQSEAKLIEEHSNLIQIQLDNWSKANPF